MLCAAEHTIPPWQRLQLSCIETAPAAPSAAPPQSGEFQRWRLAWATAKRWASLAVVDKHGEPAPCEMLLVGKDAVYLMEVRSLYYIYLSQF